MRYGETMKRTAHTLLALQLASCATNPVTGERELALISEEQEIEMGRQAHEEVVASMGLVENDELQGYVSDLGMRLAEGSERPHLPWTFAVLDDPTVNAFALPGGFVYVTRGMMGHLTSEAQLVGILGHEIGHVTARHSVNQMSRAQLANLGLGVGMILAPEELQPLGEAAGAGLQLLFLSFSRDDERQSDELGVAYMSRLGYDPAELASVFEMLGRLSEASGGGLPTWASTHPAPEDRQERILTLAGDHPGAERVERDGYHGTVEGLTFGVDPREGFFQDGVFHHPELRFRIEIPRGWQGVSSRNAVQALSEDRRAALVLTLAEAGSPREALSAFEGQEGVTVTGAEERSIHGIPAVVAGFQAATEQGEVRGTVMFPELRGNVYAVYGYSAAPDWSDFEGPVGGALASFQEETDRAVLAVRPNHIEVVDVAAGTAFSEFVERHPSSVPAAVVALINQVDESGTMPDGPAKRVTSG